jgi:hypothetical protein
MGFWRGVGRSVNPYTGVKTFFEGMDELVTFNEQMESENARLDAQIKQEYQKMFGDK